MRRKILRTFWAGAVILMLGIPVSAARMLVPVGRVVGLSVVEGTVTVAAFDDELGEASREAGIEVGDEILTVDGTEIDSAEDLHKALERSNGTVSVEVRRQDQKYEMKVSPKATAEGPRLGIFLREGVTGIGTVTYFDPQTKEFGALGHGVSDGHGKVCAMDRGAVYPAGIVGIRQGEPGHPGQLKGFVTAREPIAPLQRNTACGIFGQGGDWHGEALPVAEVGEVKMGEAQILSNIEGDRVETFTIQIRRRNDSADANGRDLLLEVTDPDLLAATGGIVAGMSGSPIIQDGKLVGAVTHVLVNDPTRGYGILIENMLNAAA